MIMAVYWDGKHQLKRRHMFQIRFWKTDDPENTRKEIDIKANRVHRAAVVGKERWTVKTLYPFSNVSMDIVALNTYYESNASDVIEITTPEGGR